VIIADTSARIEGARLNAARGIGDHLLLDIHGNPVASVALGAHQCLAGGALHHPAVVPCGEFAATPTEAAMAPGTPSTAMPAR
jgi:hypothetical protein